MNLIRTISILICAIVSFICTAAYAQNNNCGIQGIVGSQDGGVLQYADVFLKHSQKDSIITYTQSDEAGKFVMNAPAGTYRLGINYIGYKSYNTNVELGEKTVDLGTVKLEGDAYELQTVVVKGEALNIKNTTDGFIVNVEDIRKTSNNSLDLLRRMPMVSVKNEDLKVIGKDNVIVKIGNVTQRVSGAELSAVLKGYESSLIKSVEVIMQPPLKYNPDGNTAMIILHTSSFFNNYLGVTIGTEEMIGENHNYRYGGYSSFIYNKKNLFMSISPSANFNSSGMKEYSSYERNGVNDYAFYSSSVGKSDYAGGSFNLQYQYKQGSNVGVFFTYGLRKRDNEFNNKEIDNSKEIIGLNTYDLRIPKIFASTYWESKLGNKGGKTWMELTYSNLSNKSNTDYYGNYSTEDKYFFTYTDNDKIRVNGVNFINDYSFYVDDNRKYMIETGVKALYSYTKNSRDHEQWKEGLPKETFSQSSKMELNELLLKPYVSGTVRFSKNVWMRAGVNFSGMISRINQEGVSKDVTKNRLDVLPNLHTSFTLSKNHQLSFVVNTSIAYPSYKDLNPFEWIVNERSVNLGNVNLLPSVTYGTNLVYSYKGAISATAKIWYRDRIISPVIRMDDNGMIYTRTENAQSSTFYGVTLNYYYSKIRWLIFSASADYGYTKYKSDLDGISSTADGAEFYIEGYVDIAFNRKRTVTGYVSGSYEGKRNTAVSVIDPKHNVGAGLSFFMLQRRLSISCAGMNLFSSKHTGVSKRNGYKITFNNRYDYPTLYFSVSYRFSTKAKNISNAGRRISTQDVERRF